ncbi:MAG TPA: hypothetical protein VF297_26455 [Pyrinomonadaceae bacterium]
MKKSDLTDWPPLQAAYTDEFGRIEPEVYQAAKAVWEGGGQQLARSKLGDAHAGLRLMLKAAANVTRVYLNPNARIENLPSYLYTAYKRLLLAELEKLNGHRQRDAQLHVALTSEPDTTAADLDKKIELQGLYRRMDQWTRKIFVLRVYGYTFDEIGKFCGASGDGIRTRFAKKVHLLLKELEAETRAAEQKRAAANLAKYLLLLAAN